MKKLVFVFFLQFLSIQFLFAQSAPAIEWQKCLGGSSTETTHSIEQTLDGGFIIAGNSGSNDGDVSGHHGSANWDYWIVKLDPVGNLVWQKCLGGNSDDFAYSVRQTSDNGFIVAGWSLASSGDVSGNHGGVFVGDYWVVRLDKYGNLKWQKCLGGTKDDAAYSVTQTSDGGFVVAGYSASNDGDVTDHHGSTTLYDCWIVKLDSIGNLVWQKSLGGSDAEIAYSIQQTNDGGLIVGAYSKSNDGDVSGNHGAVDYWIIKLTSDGNLVWQKSFGGSDWEKVFSIQQTSDLGYIVAGYSGSNNDDVSGNHGGEDYWIVKLDNAGNTVWQKCLGGSGVDEGYSIKQTIDGRYVVAGYSDSNNDDVSGNHGNLDYWIIRLDTDGSLLWQKSLGGSQEDEAFSIAQTSEGGFIVAGYTRSNDNDVSGNHDDLDCWIVKLSPDTITSVETPNLTFSFSIFPNPTFGNFQITFPTSIQQPTLLTITNLLGQKLFEEPILVGTSTRSFDFDKGQRGIYMVRSQSVKGIRVERLVVQ